MPVITQALSRRGFNKTGCAPQIALQPSVMGIYISLRIARLDLEKALSNLEKDAFEWSQLKKDIVDDPVERAVNPLEPALLTEFLQFGEHFDKERRRLADMYLLIGSICEN